MTGYDWTYLSGTGIYDTKDKNTSISSITEKLEELNLAKIEKIQTKIQKSYQAEEINAYYTQERQAMDIYTDDEDDSDTKEDEYDSDTKEESDKMEQLDDIEVPGNLERLQSDQIEVAWLLTINEWEFIMTITPTPCM